MKYPRFLAVVFVVAAQSAVALPIPAGSTIVAENSFTGSVTNVTLENWATPGGVDVGTQLFGEYVLYEDPMYSGELHIYSHYTFHGTDRDYSFYIDGGPSSGWGSVTLNPTHQLSLEWSNNFDSDGLENTFNHGWGYDYGYFDINMEDYDTPAIDGFGSFGFSGVDINFELGSPIEVAVSEPSSLALLGLGSLALIWRRRHQYSDNQAR